MKTVDTALFKVSFFLIEYNGYLTHTNNYESTLTSVRVFVIVAHYYWYGIIYLNNNMSARIDL